jgi:hypothetical protein
MGRAVSLTATNSRSIAPLLRVFAITVSPAADVDCARVQNAQHAYGAPISSICIDRASKADTLRSARAVPCIICLH